jgi:hypothetical protein
MLSVMDNDLLLFVSDEGECETLASRKIQASAGFGMCTHPTQARAAATSSADRLHLFVMADAIAGKIFGGGCYVKREMDVLQEAIFFEVGDRSL